MWTSVAFAAALMVAPSQASQLTLTHVRSTYGILGAPRPDNKFLPGDNFVLSFDIEGAKTDAEGRVLYSIAMEVSDAAGKVMLRQAPRDLEAINSLGGPRLPAFASLQIGLDASPGKHTVKVTVTDRAGKVSQSVTGSYEVLPLSFGLVRPTLTGDADGRVPLPVVGEGQPVYVNFSTIGFGRDQGGRPNLSVALRVLDDKGQPVRTKPMIGEVRSETPPNVRALPMQFALDPNRAGDFTIELKAQDKATGKSATLTLPLTVIKAK